MIESGLTLASKAGKGGVRLLAWSALMALALAGCEQKSGQNTYKAGDVGRSQALEFGTVLNAREVNIVADDKEDLGAGALVGAGTGGLGGSYVGDGTGNIWGAIGGALAGAVIGQAVEQEIRASTGVEYTLEMRDGEIKTIVQEKIKGERVFEPGDKVMLQYCDSSDLSKKCYPEKAGFQRLLPVSKFPDAAPRPNKKKKHVAREAE